MQDEWDFSDVRPIGEEEEEDPGLPDHEAQEAAQVLERKSDLTDDKIDWKKLREEDERHAKDLATQKRWDPRRFWDADWCAACELRPRAGDNNRQTISEAVWEVCNAAVLQTYENSKMEVVLKTVRDKWVSDLVQRMLDGEAQDESMLVKYWSRRQIYEHLHSHNRTRLVSLAQDGKRFEQMTTELFEARIRHDPVTGLSNVDTRVVKAFRDLNKEKWLIYQERRKEVASGDRRFF